MTYLKVIQVIFKPKLFITGKNDLLLKSWIIGNKSLDTNVYGGGGGADKTDKQSKADQKANEAAAASDKWWNTCGSALCVALESPLG